MLHKDQQYIRSIRLLRDKVERFDIYPYCLPAISCLHELAFHPRVTFIVGENGTGKSTLLEAVAIAWGFNAEGGTINFTFSTQASHSELNEYIRLVKGIKRPRDGFFLRADSFCHSAFNFSFRSIYLALQEKMGTGTSFRRAVQASIMQYLVAASDTVKLLTHQMTKLLFLCKIVAGFRIA